MGDESRNQQRDALAQEAIKRLPKTLSLSLDCIRKGAKQDTLFYLPSLATKCRFINEWLIGFNNTVIVSTNASLLKKNMMMNITTVEDFISGKKKSGNVLISLSEFMSMDLSFLNYRLTLIFDGVENIDQIEMIKAHPLYKVAIIKIQITESPILFTYYLKNPTPTFECYTGNLFLRSSYYRSIIEASDFFYFDDNPDGMNDFRSKIGNIPDEDLLIAEFLLTHDIYYSFLFNEASLISDKLHCLLRIIDLLEGDCLLVYFRDELEERIVHELLNVHAGGDKEISKKVIRGLINGTEPQRSMTRSSVIIRNQSQVTVQFVRDPSGLKETSYPLVLFDFFHIIAPIKIFILPESKRNFIKEIAVDESNMGKAYSEYVSSIRMEKKVSFDSPMSLNRFELLTKDIKAVRKSVRGRGFIYSVSMENGHVHVTTGCKIGKIPTCFNLHSITNEPVVMPRFFQNNMICMVSDKIELCTITGFKTLCSGKVIHGNGYVIMGYKGITVFSFSKERSLMIEIGIENIEDYIMVGTNRWQHWKKPIQPSQGYTNIKNRREELDGFKSTVKTYLSLISNKQISKEVITIALCLKIKPKVYTTYQSMEIVSIIASESSVFEKTREFHSLSWRRLSADDFPDFEEQFDIRISIPCFQDICHEFLEQFIYQCKGFGDTMDDKALDQFSHTVKIRIFQEFWEFYPVILLKLLLQNSLSAQPLFPLRKFKIRF